MTEVIKEVKVLPPEVAAVKNKGLQTKPYMVAKVNRFVVLFPWEGGDIRLKITLVPKVLKSRYIMRWIKNLFWVENG